MPRSKKTKIIIDTNLFISFLIGKQLRGLKGLLVDHKIELIFSEQHIQELRIVAQRPKFNIYFTASNLNDLIDLIYSIGQVFVIVEIKDICRDPKDNFLLELASKSKADYLVTGDKDLLDIRTHKSTRIITIKELESIMKSGI